MTHKKTTKKTPAKRTSPKARTTKTVDCVVVRTYSAGVHVGRLVSQDGKVVVLADAVRIYRWRGARTLSEVAMGGIDSAAESGHTRVSVPLPSITLTEAIEIIPCSATAELRIRGAGWAP